MCQRVELMRRTMCVCHATLRTHRRLLEGDTLAERESAERCRPQLRGYDISGKSLRGWGGG